MTWEIGLGLATLFFTLVAGIFKILRTLAKDKEELWQKIEDRDKDTRGVLMLAVDRSRTDFAESLKAIRQHSQDAHERIDQVIMRHQELELYIRDNYVEVKSFETALARVERSVEVLVAKIDRFLEVKAIHPS